MNFDICLRNLGHLQAAREKPWVISHALHTKDPWTRVHGDTWLHALRRKGEWASSLPIAFLGQTAQMGGEHVKFYSLNYLKDGDLLVQN